MADRGKPVRFRRLFLVGAVTITALSGCKKADPPPDRAVPAATASDNAVPIEEALRRFSEGLPVVTRLEGGAPSRDALVRAFISAVEANDTAAVGRMHVTRAEYAHLYFPTSVYMNKPYEQDPAIAWFLSAQSSEKGISRVMRRLGGHDLQWRKHTCDGESREGANTFVRNCTLDYFDPQDGKRVTRSLFGTVIERDGQHKFLSYANDF